MKKNSKNTRSYEARDPKAKAKEKGRHKINNAIRDGRILAGGCMLPLSKNVNLSRDLGMRHRAGIGMSENSDAVCVVVSEETGQVSIAHNGRILRRQEIARLDTILHALLTGPRQPSLGKEPREPRA